MNKRKKHKELEVDFIGHQEPLTHEQERLISEYFKNRKLISALKKCKKRVQIN